MMEPVDVKLSEQKLSSTPVSRTNNDDIERSNA